MSKNDQTLVIPGDDDDDDPKTAPLTPTEENESPHKGVSETMVVPSAQHEIPKTRRKQSETLVASADEVRAAAAAQRQQRGQQFNAPEDFVDAREEKKERRPVLLFLLPVGLIAFLLLGAASVYVVTRMIPPAATEEVVAVDTVAPSDIPPTTIILPNAPASIRAVVVAIYDIPVGWTDTSDNEEGFYIYRARVDLGQESEQVGSVSTDTTTFLDTGTTCGAIYEYTISSFNSAGEAPTTECWQIIVPTCPATQTADIGSGSDRGLNFITGAKGIDADFYWTSGESPMLMADLPGQKGFFDLGNTGATPLYDVVIPQGEAAESLPLVAGNTYVLFPRDSYSVVVFRAAAISEPLSVEYIIWQPGSETIGQCGQLASIPTPEPTPTTGGGVGCVARGGDGVCCVAAGETNANAPNDCRCVDDGVCNVTAGETSACCDCDANCGGTCGRACSTSSQCARGLSCAGGVCWDACACGQDCGGGQTCTRTNVTTHCDQGWLVYVDNCGVEVMRNQEPNICPFKP